MTSALTPQQQAVRSKGIGASEIAAVIGASPHRTALDVWLEKTGQVPSFEGNDYTEWGTRIEPVILKAYAEKNVVKVLPSGTLVHAVHSFVIATPDGIVERDDDPPDDRHGLEVKLRGQEQRWLWGEPGTDEVPIDVAAQCHYGMAVTGLSRWDVAVLFSNRQFLQYTLRRDEDLAAGLIEQARHFWFTYVVPRVTPPLDGSESTHAFLAKKYPNHAMDLVAVAEGPLVDYAAALREVKEQAKALEVRQSELEVFLKDAIGEHSGLQLPFGKVTWNLTKSGGIDYKGLVEKLTVNAVAAANVLAVMAGAKKLSMKQVKAAIAILRDVDTAAFARPGHRRFLAQFDKLRLLKGGTE